VQDGRRLGKLQKKISKDSRIVISDLGWIAEGTKLPKDVVQELAGLEVGQTSKVVPPYNESASPEAYYLVKVLERKGGSQASFEAARPQIENYLYGITKDIMTEFVPYACKISKDPQG